jgi:hypothetical protein
MYKLFVITLSLAFAGNSAFAQGSSQGPGVPQPGTGSGTVFMPGAGSAPVPEAAFMAQCVSNLASLASQKLQAQLILDKAVTKQVLASAAISESALGASCNNVCAQYAKTAHMISWAKRSPGFLSEPEHTLQNIYTHMAEPALPGKADLDSCLPKLATLNWCPSSGSGVGAGPTRQENPMDKIKVCITIPDALQNMNFSPADLARNCAKPSIVDAADRVKAEQLCVNDSLKAEAKAAADKAAADKAAANLTIALPSGPPPMLGSAPSARRKP